MFLQMAQAVRLQILRRVSIFLILDTLKTAQNKYYELDVNQRTVYIVDGCGTYGHPYQIKTVYSTADGGTEGEAKGETEVEEDRKMFTGADQLIAIMNLLDGKGSGTAVCIDPTTLNAKYKSAQEAPDIHTEGKASEDKDIH